MGPRSSRSASRTAAATTLSIAATCDDAANRDAASATTASAAGSMSDESAEGREQPGTLTHAARQTAANGDQAAKRPRWPPEAGIRSGGVARRLMKGTSNFRTDLHHQYCPPGWRSQCGGERHRPGWCRLHNCFRRRSRSPVCRDGLQRFCIPPQAGYPPRGKVPHRGGLKMSSFSLKKTKHFIHSSFFNRQRRIILYPLFSKNLLYRRKNA